MCAPEDLHQRVSRDDFDEFRVEGSTVWIERALLAGEEIILEVAGSGAFRIDILR